MTAVVVLRVLVVGLRILAAPFTWIGALVVWARHRRSPERRTVVFLSRQSNAPSQDFALLAAQLLASGRDVQVVMLTRMIERSLGNRILYAGHILRQLAHVSTADVVVLDTYSIVASTVRHRRGLVIVQIWHALGAFKKFGLSIVDTPEGSSSAMAAAMHMHEGYRAVFASSTRCIPAFAEAFGVARDRVLVRALPRVDAILDSEAARGVRKRIRAEHPELDGRPVALFAPTFHPSRPTSYDFAALSESAATAGCTLVVKLHPLEKTRPGPEIETLRGWSTQDALHVADVFVTDYSSSLFEAALLGLPLVLYAPDIHSFAEDRDFYLDIRHDIPARRTSDPTELTSALIDALASAAQSRLDSLAFGRSFVELPANGQSASAALASAILALAPLSGMPNPTSP